MKKWLCLLIGYISCGGFSFCQNVGIGILNPTKARLEQFAGSSLNLSNAIFGSENAGISFQQNQPAIGFNQYIDNGSAYSPRWMANGYGLKQQLDVSTGIMTWKFLRTGVQQNIIVPADEKIGMQLNYNGINGSVGLGINRAPLTSFHVLYKDPNFAATGAGFLPYGMAGFESNIDAFINVMSPIGFQNGLLMGSPLSAIRGGIIYTHHNNVSTESLALRTGGNFNRVVISGNGNIALGDFIATNKLEVDGSVAFMGQNINFADVTTYLGPYGQRFLYRLNLTKRSYFKINNSNASIAQFITEITPGTVMGQILYLEAGSLFFISEIPNSNLNIPGSDFIRLEEGDTVGFIWNGTKWSLISYQDN